MSNCKVNNFINDDLMIMVLFN